MPLVCKVVCSENGACTSVVQSKKRESRSRLTHRVPAQRQRKMDEASNNQKSGAESESERVGFR